MKRSLLFFTALLALAAPVRAQFQCGTDQLHQRQLQSDAHYKAAFEKDKQLWKQWQQMKRAGKMVVTGTDTTFEVPVVFHIMHAGQPEGSYFNPSKGAIDSLVDYLNKTWAATWPSYPGVGAGGVRMPLRFKLAQRDPDCNPTNGIVRVNASVLPFYASAGVNYDNTTSAPSDSAVKSLSKWPSGDYYNIWVVNFIDGPLGATAAAYAYYPVPTPDDGTVIAVRYVYPIMGPGEYYIAIPHELGHAYYLMHTFQDDDGGVCPDNTDCTVEGDWVCDTEPHMRDPGTCPTSADINTCTGMPYQGVQYNIMNYSSCSDRFTPMQRERVISAMQNNRPGLISSLGADAPDTAFVAPAAACIPGIDNPDNRKNIGPYDVDLGEMTAFSYGLWGDNNKAYMDRTCLQQAHLVKGKSYPLTITAMSYESDLLSARVWIDYNNNGIFETTELVFAYNGTIPSYELFSGMVAVPATGVITDKPLRMRVIVDVNGSLLTPCGNLQYGQAEDYTVIISSDPTSAGNIAMQYDVQVVPNPATNAVSVKAAYPVNVAVCGIDGRVLLRQNNGQPIDISMLAEGLYMLKITGAADGQLIKTEKLVKLAQ